MSERFETFTVLINRISRNIRKIKNREMAEHDLRSAHISCLYYLYTGEHMTATDLCEKCEEDKATISRAVEYLEKNGYIECEAKSAKRYRTELLLTEKGNLVGKQIYEKIAGVLEEISACITEEERKSFYRSLQLISENLAKVSQNSENRQEKV